MRCKSCGRFMTSNAPYGTPRGSNSEWFCTNPGCVDSGYMLYVSERLTKVIKKSGINMSSLAKAMLKKCPLCGKMKSIEDFYRYDTGGNEYTHWCIDCIEHYIANTSVGAN